MENNLNNRMNEKVLPIVAAVVGHSIWGFSYLFTRMALSVTSPDVLLTVRSVSYTHLDVYKRQLLYITTVLSIASSLPILPSNQILLL